MPDRAPPHAYEQINFKGKKEGITRCSSKRLCVFVLVVSILFNVVTGGYLIHRSISRRDSEHGTTVSHLGDVSGAVCLSCDSLPVPEDAITSYLPGVKITDTEKKTSLCCYDDSDGLGRLIKLFSRLFYSNSGHNNTDLETQRPVTPSAHVYIDLDSLKNQAGNLQWSKDPGFGSSHSTEGITYSEGSFRIPRDGVYNVYSFLTLKTSDVGYNGPTLVHQVKRIMHEQHVQVLLLGKTSFKHEESSGVFRTSYLSASLRLNQNDKIFVEFSNTSLIYKYTPANYFGLYML